MNEQRISGYCVHNWTDLERPCPECAETKRDSDEQRVKAIRERAKKFSASPDGLFLLDLIERLQGELEQEKKWKAEDPRMLREQIRVADVALNGLNERHNAALTELESLQRKFRIEQERAEQATNEILCYKLTEKQLQAQLAECQARPTTAFQYDHQLASWRATREGFEKAIDSLETQLAECEAARARLSDPTVDKRNSEEP